MNKILVLGAIGAMGLSAATVGAAVANNNAFEASQIQAASDGYTWGLKGQFEGGDFARFVTTSHYDSALDKNVMTYFIEEGTEFKICGTDGYNWMGYNIFSQSRTGGNEFFEKGSGTDDANIKVKAGKTGTYTFKFASGLASYGDKSYGITVEFVASTGMDEVFLYGVDWSSVYAYTYGGSSVFGTWPGTKVTAEWCVTSSVAFYGELNEGKSIWRISVPKTIDDDKIIFHNNAGQQTGDCNLHAGYAYYSTNVYVDGNADVGAAAAFVMDLHRARKEADGKNICNISNAQMTSFVERYNALGTAQQYVNSATDYIDSTNVSFESLVNEFVKVLARSGSGANLIGSMSSIDNGLLALGLVSSISLVGISGLVVASKKKKKA